MNKFLPLFAAAFVAATAACAETFEGKVVMQMTTDAMPPTELTFSVKEGYSRIDTAIQGRDAGIIMDASKHEMFFLMNSEKMYLERAMPKPPEKPSPTAEGAANGNSLVKTTQTEKILGYDTTKYVYTSNGTRTEAWLTDQLGSFMGMGPTGASGSRAAGSGVTWDQSLIGTNAFPLRVISTKDGKEKMRLTAASVEKEKLPDSLFAPPADFKKFDIGEMMRGMMPGGAAPSK